MGFGGLIYCLTCLLECRTAYGLRITPSFGFQSELEAAVIAEEQS